MKKRVILFVLAVMSVLGLHAQILSDFSDIKPPEEKKTFVDFPPKELSFQMPKFDYYKSYTPSGANYLNFKYEEWNLDPLKKTQLERPMDMQIMSSAYAPFFNPYTPMLRRHNPYALDFYEAERFPLTEKLSAVVSGRQETWPVSGGITTFNPSLVWNSGIVTVSGGVYAAKYFTPFNPLAENTFGLNLQTHVQATDWLGVRVWGNAAYYNSTEKNNPYVVTNPFLYQNSVGGAFEFKITEKFAIGTGLQMNFNPIRNKWERQYLVYPIFK